MLKKFLYLTIVLGISLNLACNKILNRKGDMGGSGSNSQYALTMTADDYAKDAVDLLVVKQKYEKYIGKPIEVSGTILNYSHGDDGALILHFDMGNQERNRRGIACRLDDPQACVNSHPGQQVRVGGILKELGFGALLDKCRITETSGPQLAVLDASDLEFRYEKDMNALKPHVFGKRFFVEGIVIEGKDGFGRPIPSFATNSKHPVAIEFPIFSTTEQGRLKIGEKGRVLAIINGFGVGNYQMVLTDTFVVSSTPVQK